MGRRPNVGGGLGAVRDLPRSAWLRRPPAWQQGATATVADGLAGVQNNCFASRKRQPCSAVSDVSDSRAPLKLRRLKEWCRRSPP